MLYGVLLVVQLLMAVYCALDVVTTPQDRVRHLPKLLWLALVLLFPLVGGVAWLVTGRAPGSARPLPFGGGGGGASRGGGTTPGRPAGPVRPAAPDDDEEFLRGLRRRAEEQRRAARRREQEEPPPA